MPRSQDAVPPGRRIRGPSPPAGGSAGRAPGDLGSGVLAVWNDVAPEAESEFNDWYLCEHLFERLSVPGFLRARRWWNPERSPRYFTWYETADVGTLRSAPYLARLDHPTPRTQAIMPSFRNTSRTACRVTVRIRSGEGAAAGVVRLAPGPSAAAVREWLRSDALPRAAALRGVVAVQLWESDPEATGAERTESRLRPGGDALIDWAVVVEATRPGEVDGALDVLSGAMDREATAGSPERFVLLCSMTR